MNEFSKPLEDYCLRGVKAVEEKDYYPHPWIGKQIQLIHTNKSQEGYLTNPGELYKVYPTGTGFRCFIKPFYKEDDGFAIYSIDSLDQIVLFGIDKIEYIFDKIVNTEE